MHSSLLAPKLLGYAGALERLAAGYAAFLALAQNVADLQHLCARLYAADAAWFAAVNALGEAIDSRDELLKDAEKAYKKIRKSAEHIVRRVKGGESRRTDTSDERDNARDDLVAQIRLIEGSLVLAVPDKAPAQIATLRAHHLPGYSPRKPAAPSAG